ncbi:MAG TPA: WXG100 family type VII secretion target, partial [Ktedonobacterales bacterium]
KQKRRKSVMSQIAVNTDVMRQLGQCFVAVSHYLWDDQRPRIENLIAQLEHNWQGHSRARFEHLFAQWRHEVHEVVELGYEIGQHLEQTAQAFENADNS